MAQNGWNFGSITGDTLLARMTIETFLDILSLNMARMSLIAQTQLVLNPEALAALQKVVSDMVDVNAPKPPTSKDFEDAIKDVKTILAEQL